MTPSADSPNMATAISALFASRGGELHSFISAIEVASKDPRCLGIKANFSNGLSRSMSWASCWEIKSAMDEYKKVRDVLKMEDFSFSETKEMDSKILYLAASIGHIYSATKICAGIFSFNNLSIHYKDLLEKIGLKFVATKTGKYKSLYDKFTESNVTEHEREAQAKIFEGLEEEWISCVSEKCGVEKEKVKRLLGRFIFSEELKDLGIVKEFNSDFESKSVKHYKVSLFQINLFFRLSIRFLFVLF